MRLNLRTGPGTQFRIVGGIATGDEVVVDAAVRHARGDLVEDLGDVLLDAPQIASGVVAVDDDDDDFDVEVVYVPEK